MRATIEDFVRAKGVRALCVYHDYLGGRDADWILVREFAFREWPDITPDLLEQLIALAKESRCAANVHSSLSRDERPRDCDIPGKELPPCQFATIFPSQ